MIFLKGLLRYSNKFYSAFIILGFFNVFWYLNWLGRVDFFPLIFNSLSGLLAILFSFCMIFIALSLMFVIPSIVLLVFNDMGMDKLAAKTIPKRESLRRRFNVSYNEGCCAVTAMAATIFFILTLFYFNRLSWCFSSAALGAFVVHCIFNAVFNRKDQHFWRAFLTKLKIAQTRRGELSCAMEKWFFYENCKANALSINFFYTVKALLVAFLSIMPLLIFTAKNMHLLGENRASQCIILVISYLIIFLPVTLFLFRRRKDYSRLTENVVAICFLVVLCLNLLFSSLIAQFNQRAIEIIGMASWQPKTFLIKTEAFPDFYFPEKIWPDAELLDKGMLRRVTGVVAFFNGEVRLICPVSLREKREDFFRENNFFWKSGIQAKAKVKEMSRYCLTVKSSQLFAEPILDVVMEARAKAAASQSPR